VGRSSFDACAAGIKQVEADLGPVEVLSTTPASPRRHAAPHEARAVDAVINTNLGSLFNMCRNVIEGMRERKFGRIVNISSINGQKGQLGQTNYSAAKAGEIGFTKALAQESARSGITVERHRAGYINTEMVQAVPKDVAGEEHPAADSQSAARRAGEYRALRGVPGLRRCRPDHRRDALGKRRAVLALKAPSRMQPVDRAAADQVFAARIVSAISPLRVLIRASRPRHPRQVASVRSAICRGRRECRATYSWAGTGRRQPSAQRPTSVPGRARSMCRRCDVPGARSP
jgi:NAD(P)-dependent dehydrogenase (short-subunit alcohol dehydrogenase family)